MAQILDISRDLCGAPELVRLTGGGAKSPLWRQILADAFQTPVAKLENDEGSALGAAATAALATNAFRDVRALTDAWVRVAHTTPPKPGARLTDARRVYDRLYEDLKPAMSALTNLARAQEPTP